MCVHIGTVVIQNLAMWKKIEENNKIAKMKEKAVSYYYWPYINTVMGP